MWRWRRGGCTEACNWLQARLAARAGYLSASKKRETVINNKSKYHEKQRIVNFQ